MRSAFVKYLILVLGGFFLLSTAEVFTSECEHSYVAENHYFVGTDNFSLHSGFQTGHVVPVKFLGSPFSLNEIFIFAIYPNCIFSNQSDFLSTLPSGDLYLEISSLRI
jgi:hypothetical protein